ncbi:hypothetical protein [Galactobacillus timonensis]|uniref:hypothetical protein n=1 Tax=Galactobacillus timonensis TaxID=2041840 RepID=UPI001436C2B0|nr:hypothetical protein [Galactobacillus timonensis]
MTDAMRRCHSMPFWLLEPFFSKEFVRISMLVLAQAASFTKPGKTTLAIFLETGGVFLG